MKTVLVILVVLALVVGGALIVVGARASRRGWQRHSGLERQRDSAKQSRVTAADRLKRAERSLTETQRSLVERNNLSTAQGIESQRRQLSTLADRVRYATYGYSSWGSSNPVREAELAELQQRDADTIADAQAIVELTEQPHTVAKVEQPLDLDPLSTAIDDFSDALDRRKAAS